MLNSEQLFSTYKNSFDSLFSSNPNTPESVKKLVDLNLQAAQSAVDDANKVAQAVTSAKTPQELQELQTALMKSVAERTVAYSQKLFEIASGSAADVDFSKFTQGLTGGQQPFMGMLDNMAKAAPAGTEPMVAAMKNAMSVATNAMEAMQKAVAQATSQAEAGFSAMTGAATSATKPTKGGKSA